MSQNCEEIWANGTHRRTYVHLKKQIDAMNCFQKIDVIEQSSPRAIAVQIAASNAAAWGQPYHGMFNSLSNNNWLPECELVMKILCSESDSRMKQK